MLGEKKAARSHTGATIFQTFCSHKEKKIVIINNLNILEKKMNRIRVSRKVTCHECMRMTNDNYD